MIEYTIAIIEGKRGNLVGRVFKGKSYGKIVLVDGLLPSVSKASLLGRKYKAVISEEKRRYCRASSLFPAEENKEIAGEYEIMIIKDNGKPVGVIVSGPQRDKKVPISRSLFKKRIPYNEIRTVAIEGDGEATKLIP